MSISGIPQVEPLNDGSLRLRFKADGELSKRIVARSVALGWELREITLEKGSLDEVFAQLSSTKRNR